MISLTRLIISVTFYHIKMKKIIDKDAVIESNPVESNLELSTTTSLLFHQLSSEKKNYWI